MAIRESPGDAAPDAAPGPAADLLERSDVELVALVAQGYGRALEALFLRFGTPAYSLAVRVLTDRSLAHDVVQECFLALWKAPEKYAAERGAFSSWFMAMVHHKAVDAVRREESLRRRRTGTEELDETFSTLRTDEAAVDLVKGERVRDALTGLPVAQREALVLAYWGGFTQREIAGLTDTPLGTVKTRMSLGMKHLRRRLDGWSDAATTDGFGMRTGPDGRPGDVSGEVQP